MPQTPHESRSRSRAHGLSLPSPHGQYVPAVEVTRGPFVESVHAAAAAVTDAGGRVVARLGGIDHVVFLRSSAKPFQAMAVIESGAVERFGLTPPEIAVMAGSHSSEPEHLETVAGILRKIGLTPDALQCGTHTPYSRKVAQEYRRAGRAFTPLEHNCSGKHAGMLAAALAGGQNPRTYLDSSHPVQQRVMGILADMTGRMRDRIVVAVDGCGAPTLGVTLSEAARAFARLLSRDGLDPKHRDAAGQVVLAMRRHPLMIAGSGMLDTELTAMPDRETIAKRGAEGVQCGAFVSEGAGLGFAAKVADGDNGRARIALSIEILIQMQALTRRDAGRLGGTETLVVRNDVGRQVGEVKAVFRLQIV